MSLKDISSLTMLQNCSHLMAFKTPRRNSFTVNLLRLRMMVCFFLFFLVYLNFKTFYMTWSVIMIEGYYGQIYIKAKVVGTQVIYEPRCEKNGLRGF